MLPQHKIVLKSLMFSTHSVIFPPFIFRSLVPQMSKALSADASHSSGWSQALPLGNLTRALDSLTRRNTSM